LLLLALKLDNVYSAVDSKAEALKDPQVIASGVGGGVSESNATHGFPVG